MPYASERRLPLRVAVGAVGLLLLSTVVVVLESHTDVRAAVPPAPGEIAFTRAVPVPEPSTPPPPRIAAPATQADLFRVPAAAPFTPVTSFPNTATAGDETQPAWSPDGRRIAFVRRNTGTGQSSIWVADADGTGVRQVTSPPIFIQTWHDRDPSWSPDSLRLVFTRSTFGELLSVSDLKLVSVPRSGPIGPITTLLSETSVWASQPDWSPDGQQIAYRAQTPPGSPSHIATIAPDGVPGPELTSGSADALPAWSPDGSQLAYVTLRSSGGGGSINLLTIGGGTVVLVSPSGPVEFPDLATEPAWSPDGKIVLYAWLSGGGSGDIRGIPAAGGAPFNVVAGTNDDREPAWRPSADLHLEVTSSPPPLLFGQPGAVVATISNGGPATAREVAFQLHLPEVFHAVAVEPPGCVLAAMVTCVLGSLRSGESVVVRITGRPTTFAAIGISANTSSSVADPDPIDNVFEGSLDVAGSDLAIEVVDLGTPYIIDSPVRYAVRATLRDGDPVDDAVVELRLPTNVTFDGVDAPAGVACTQLEPRLLRCVLGSMGSEDPTSVQLTVRATATELGEQQGSATITSSAFDPDSANSTTTFTTRVIAPKLAVAKQAPDTAVVGDEFDYDLNVRNGGEVVVIDGVLTDQIPAGLTVVAVESATATCATTSAPVATVTCQLPRLAAASPNNPGGTAQVRIRVHATAPGPVANTACVRFTGAQPPSPGPEGVKAVAPRVFEDCNTATTQVPAGDLAVAVSTVGTVYVGGAFPATVTVTNAGDATVPAAVRLQLPAIACEKPVSAKCVAVTRDVTLGPLGPGQSTAVPLSLVPVVAGTATITARVLPATFDRSAANDVATTTVTVKQPRIVAVPPLGPPGFVTLIRGTDFPPGASVTLSWSSGLTLAAPPVLVTATGAGAGTFVAQLLVARRDSSIGPRLVVATTVGLLFPVSTNFLVVPATFNPPDFAVRS